MNKWLWVAVATVLSGCAAPTIPYKRPMQESYQPAVKDLQVYTYADERGIGVGYMGAYERGRGGQPSVTIGSGDPGVDAVVNLANLVVSAGAVVVAAVSEEMARAESKGLATELWKGFDRAGTERQLQAALASHLREVPWLRPQTEVKSMKKDQWLEAGSFTEPAVMTVALDYVMNQELTHLYLIAHVRILSKDLQYPSVYPGEQERWAKAREERERELRRAQREGRRPSKEVPVEERDQLYRNVMIFTSAALPMAYPSNAEINEQSKAIRARYSDSRGNLTTDREQILKMNRELRAYQETVSPAALRARRAGFWVANDGAELKRALNEGVQTLAQLIARDVRDTQVPLAGSHAADHVEPVANGSRRVVRKGGGVQAGQYVSEPVPMQAQPWNSIARGERAATQQ
jgi:hypothetical protein